MGEWVQIKSSLMFSHKCSLVILQKLNSPTRSKNSSCVYNPVKIFGIAKIQFQFGVQSFSCYHYRSVMDYNITSKQQPLKNMLNWYPKMNAISAKLLSVMEIYRNIFQLINQFSSSNVITFKCLDGKLEEILTW